MKAAWHVIEPGNPYVPNWHIDAMCEHLEAVTSGEITRLLINVPPGSSKSTIVGVMWPCWEWAIGLSHYRYLGTSHSERLAIRDNLRCRRLIESDWYQSRWPMPLAKDQNAKGRFENLSGGFREAMPFTSLTGSRGDRVILDDPLSVDDANSEVERDNVNTTFRESLPTRLNNPKDSAIIVVMQRLHEDDVSGLILSKDFGYEHLMIPMEFEADRLCVTSIGWSDPRRKEGELMFPERFPREVVERDKVLLGSYACTPAESPVLMADLTNKPISEVREGDMVVGFARRQRQDNTPSRFTTLPSKVLAVHRYHAPVVKMTLDSGAVVRCTPDHKWFRKARNDQPSATDGLHYAPAKVGTRLARVAPAELPVLSPDELRDAGWLSGFFDGEGTVTRGDKGAASANYKPSSRIAFYQGAGRNLPLCDKLEQVLTRFGFQWVVTEDERKPNKDAPCYGYRCYQLSNGTHSSLPMFQRFLHIAQPTKWRDRIVDGAFGAKFVQGRERVVSIEPDGVEDVFALTTETGNYVVWGLASSNSAGQFQQRPAPKGGGILKRGMWELWGNPDDPDDPAFRVFPAFDLIIGSLDGAYTEKEQNDPCAMTLWGVFKDPHDVPRAMLINAWRERLDFHPLVEKTHATCKRFKVDRLLIEAKATGISVGQELRRLYSNYGYSVELVNPDRDKVARAYGVQPIFENGTVFAPDRSWADMVITECEQFPRGKHDDLVDTVTQALRWLRDRGFLIRTDEHRASLHEASMHRGAGPKPLYPGMRRAPR